MKKIYLGHTKQGEEIALDFEAERIKFILLAGGTGSGKSIFHNNLYKQLSVNYSSNEIGFVFLDNTMVDFNGWQSDYLVKSVMGRPRDTIKALVEIANQDSKKILFVHIEECDMVYADRMAVEAALEKIKDLKDVYVVYSTSRIDRGYFTDWLRRFIDLKAIFSVSTDDDSNFLIGSDMARHFSRAGERVLVFNGRQVICQPFTDKEVKDLSDFRL